MMIMTAGMKSQDRRILTPFNLDFCYILRSAFSISVRIG